MPARLISHRQRTLVSTINCYFTNLTDQRSVNLESLLGVIKHLHEDFSLDESKSSILEAHTLEGFITEKYPEFLFENGSVEAGNEDEIYILASLLLFFVCVNSKDTDIKNALCTKLNGEQQEIILKFNKCLMECPVIMYRDVEAAIKEACKQDGSRMEQQGAVAETPPALRSLHSEVQRLRASLDAERFDRNYLQDELARTNFALEKLLKEKDEYKQEITMLRAKVSSCQNEEAEAQTKVGEDDLASVKLMRQLEELQTRFLDTQAQLEDVQHELNAYKKKIEELKAERDKWIAFGQQQSDRSAQLSHQLDSECRNVESLRELVAELGQHHKRNGFDVSQLECDDPDISVKSSVHNMSACSEVCSNVVEVQLEEERARIAELTKLSQDLQNQIQSLEETAYTEKAAFDMALSEKDVEIQNLKNQISTEIDKLKAEYLAYTAQSKENHSKLETDICIKEEKIQQLNSQLVEKSTVIDNNAKELNDCKHTIEKINEDLKSLHNEHIKLQEEVKDVTSQRDMLQSELDYLSNAFADEKYDLEMSLHQKDASLAVMALDLEQQVNLTKELQSDISEFKEIVLTLPQELKEFKEIVLTLTQEHKEKIRNLDELTIKYDTINKELADVVCSKDNLQQTIMLMNTEIQEQIRILIEKDEIILLNSIDKKLSNELKNSKAAGRSEVSVMNLPVQEVCARIAEFTQFTMTLQDQLRSLGEITSAEITTLKEKLSERDSEIKILKDQISTEIEEKVKLTELNNCAIGELNLKVNELVQKISLIREKSANDIEIKGKEILELQEEKSTLTVQLDDLKNTVLDTQKQLETIQHEQDTYKAKMEELKAERDKWAAFSQKESDQVARLSYQMEEEHRSADVLREFVAKQNTQNAAQGEVITNLEEEIEKERTRFAHLTQCFQTLQDQMKSLKDKTHKENIELEKALSKSKADTEILKLQISAEIEEKTTLTELNKDEINTLNNKMNEMEQKSNLLKNYVYDMENKMKDMQKIEEENAMLTSKLENLEKIILDKQAQLNICAYVNTELERERVHIIQLTQLSQSLKDQLKTLDEMSSAEKATLKKELCESDAVIENLKRRISLETEQKIENNNQIIKLNNQKGELELKINNILQEFRCAIEKKTVEIEELQEEKSMFMAKLEKFEKDLLDRLVQLEVYSNLEEQLKEERMHIAELTQLLHTLQNQLKSLEQSSSAENAIFMKTLSEKNAEIESFKLQISKEIEEKVILNERNKDEMCTLNNKINELELTIKEVLENSTNDMENKRKEILRLQEEKSMLTVQLEDLEKILCYKQEQLKSCACGNLKEQLEEERTHFFELTQLSQSLQVKLELLENTSSAEKATLEKVLSERNSEIENLKHNISVEYEEKVKLTENHKDTIFKLTNETHLLKQKIENILKESICEIENKRIEVKKLLKNNITLMQNISDYIWKFETVIKKQDAVIDDYEKKQEMRVCGKDDAQTDVKPASTVLGINLTEEFGFFEKLLLDRRSQFEELQHELDAYIPKIEELKAERDKWMALGEQQSERAARLAHHLDSERRNVESLKELMEEKHAQHNDAFANLQEQIEEKNGRISELTQLSEALQGQIQLIEMTASSEKAALHTALSERNAEVEHFKHQMKIEEEEKIKITQCFNKLTVKIKELEQKVINVTNRFLSDIENNMKIIQKLQEEKSTLIQIITQEISKLEKLIKSKDDTTPDEFTDENKQEITLCSEESESVISVGAVESVGVGLAGRLKALEETLLAKHAQREKCHLELDMYKAKVEELQEEREQLLELRQQECSRGSQLADELSAALRTRDNIAVQLEEERARTEQLTQLYQALQIQTKSLEDIYSTEKEMLDKALSEKSAEIECLKDEINEIKEKNKLTENNNIEMSRLNSDQSELEQKMDDSAKHTACNVENKNKEIQKLQEEKSTLIQSFSNEITKLESIIKDQELSIYDLKRQVSKKSVTESRANQIIKLSAKYQAIILKRIAEIKTQKEVNAGAITMDELEKFLETTDIHLRRYSDKQTLLQKEKDALAEICSSKESEMINVKKFLTELCLYIKTFMSVKETYVQKLSRVISIQRTVRREMHNLEGHVSDSTTCKLEKDYAAIMQDLTECAMNMERWAGNSIEMAVSPEKIKQAFKSEISISTGSLQNTGLELQFDDLESSFKKLLEEISRAKVVDPVQSEANTVMKVRAEYEDKLERMKQKMKQLYQEQIGVFRERQKGEIASLERELAKANERLAESSRAYEEHIRGLTTELWSVGEKFLMKKDEADWLRKKQRSGSLMSLQHTHSSGITSAAEEKSRPSDTFSLRSLPVHTKQTERRGLHMSDEEGEVFDNRWLRELRDTPPAASSVPPDVRLSELRWRNSLCPPHLKSSYPAETQFAPAVDEDDIKSMTVCGGRRQRKEVGITAYKKPGPPTPSKQAGRLSATDSELRESLRPEPESQAPRKTSTPSRIRALFRSHRNEADNSSTPRSKRLSIFRSKK